MFTQAVTVVFDHFMGKVKPLWGTAMDIRHVQVELALLNILDTAFDSIVTRLLANLF